jgi:hypothetical protein
VPPSPRRLKERVAYLIRLRRLVTAEAEAFVLEHYRRHRRMPPAYVLALLPSTTVRRLRLRGELEFLLRIPSFYRFSRLLLDRAIDRCRGSPDVRSRQR